MSITKENAAQWLPLVRAMVEGKEMQRNIGDHSWSDRVPAYALETDRHPDVYRIKPAPVLRAWTKEEAPKCFAARAKVTGHYILVEDGKNWHTGDPIEWGFLAREFDMIPLDGAPKPCGVLVDHATSEKAR